MPITGEVIVWAKPSERTHLKLMSGDIEKASECFKNKTGEAPKMIALNPKNEHLAGEADENIKVNYSKGCLLWEIWLSGEDNFRASKPFNQVGIEGEKAQTIAGYLPNQMSTLNDNNSKVDISKVSVASGGTKSTRKKYKELPEDFIKQLADKDMGSKAIATQLRIERGVKVSYKTIQRLLAEQRTNKGKQRA